MLHGENLGQLLSYPELTSPPIDLKLLFVE